MEKYVASIEAQIVAIRLPTFYSTFVFTRSSLHFPDGSHPHSIAVDCMFVERFFCICSDVSYCENSFLERSLNFSC